MCDTATTEINIRIYRGASFQIQTFWVLEAEQYLLFVRQTFSLEFCALEYWRSGFKLSEPSLDRWQ